jgi:hypothetical protein
MNEKRWFRSHVERLLEEAWGLEERVVKADDERYYCDAGTAFAWVAVENEQHPMAVRIIAWAALDVRFTAKVVRELNEINAASRFGWVYWYDGTVACEAALPADAVTADNLRGLWGATVARANEIGPLIAAVHGGHVPFEQDVTDDEEVA